MEKILGMKIPQTRVSQIFRSLSLETHPAGNKVVLDRTGLRDDLKIEEDLIEEVLRIEGFDKIPTALPWTNHTDADLKDVKKTRLSEFKKYLAASGFQEIITYSLLSEKALLDTGFKTTDAVRITNAVSAEQAFLRPSLLSGALQSAVHNLHRKNAAGRFFEAGKRFSKNSEETALSLTLYGNFEDNWKRRSPVTFYDLKGAVENILAYFKIDGVEWRDAAEGAFSQGIEGSWHGKKIVTLGGLSPSLLKVWDIPTEVFYAEFSLDVLLASEPPSRRVRSLPKYPSAKRDVAFVADEKILVGDLEKAVRRAAGPSLQEVVLFDEYKGKGIAAGKRSLAFSLSYQKETGTFTEEEIQALQTRVTEALKAEYAVEFR
jgi:phenylalanyl-tRNA synthetase beta chain